MVGLPAQHQVGKRKVMREPLDVDEVVPGVVPPARVIGRQHRKPDRKRDGHDDDLRDAAAREGCGAFAEVDDSIGDERRTSVEPGETGPHEPMTNVGMFMLRPHQLKRACPQRIPQSAGFHHGGRRYESTHDRAVAIHYSGARLSSERLVAIFYRLLRRVRRPPYWLRLTLLVLGIVFSYWFIVTAGTFTHWPTWNTNYDLQAEGFRAGHLYLLVQTHPELLKAADPFDPSLARYWFWDASLHKGHIYLYWGPLPAVILAGLKAALSWNFVVGDQYFVFAFYTIHLIAGTLLITRMARRLFPGLPFPLVVLGVLVFAYATPTPFIVATPGIYQAAIIGGQAFLLLGLVFAFDAVWKSPSGPPSRRLLIAAGCFWGLGISTRVTIGPPVALIILVTAFLTARPGTARSVWWQRLRTMVWLGAPVTAFVSGLLLYNWARFDSFLEFGTHNQMSTMQFRTAWAYLLPDLYSYFLRPMVLSCRFPFLTAPFDLGALAFPRGFQVPDGYMSAEPVAGLLLATPWIWFVAAAGIVGGRRAWRSLRTGPTIAALDARERTNAWFALSFAIIGTVTGLPIVALFIATMRYLVDVASGLILLGTWGAWSLYWSVRDRPWPRRATTVAIVGVAVATIVIGLLLGVTGYNKMFELHNPRFHQRMVQAFSLCSSSGR